jgi:hypothetical protein
MLYVAIGKNRMFGPVVKNPHSAPFTIFHQLFSDYVRNE